MIVSSEKLAVASFLLAFCGLGIHIPDVVLVNPRKPTKMLSEHHDIRHELPEFESVLESLKATDPGFTSLVEKHDLIDDEIRQLEEKQLPISDEEIEKMKFQRTALKDQIYQILRDAARAVTA